MAVKLDPDYAEAYANRGLAFLLQYRNKNAEKDFQRALALSKELKAELEKRIKKIETQRMRRK